MTKPGDKFYPLRKVREAIGRIVRATLKEAQKAQTDAKNNNWHQSNPKEQIVAVFAGLVLIVWFMGNAGVAP